MIYKATAIAIYVCSLVTDGDKVNFARSVYEIDQVTVGTDVGEFAWAIGRDKEGNSVGNFLRDIS